MKTEKYLIPILMSLIAGCSLKQEQSQTKGRTQTAEELRGLLKKAEVRESKALIKYNNLAEETNLRRQDAFNLHYKTVADPALDTLESLDLGRINIGDGYIHTVDSSIRPDFGKNYNEIYKFFGENNSKLNKEKMTSLVNIVNYNVPGYHHVPGYGDNYPLLMKAYPINFVEAVKKGKTTHEELFSLIWKNTGQSPRKIDYIQGLPKYKGKIVTDKQADNFRLKAESVGYLQYYHGILKYAESQGDQKLVEEIKGTVQKSLTEKYVPSLKQAGVDTSWLAGKGSLSEKLFSN